MMETQEVDMVITLRADVDIAAGDDDVMTVARMCLGDSGTLTIGGWAFDVTVTRVAEPGRI